MPDCLAPGGRHGLAVTEVSNETSIAAGGEQELAQQGIVAHPRLWSLETPTLYHLLTFVQVNGQTVDNCDTAFGIRTVRFDAEKGFFLNGKPVKIQGTCNHQDFAGVGIAVPDTLEYWRVKKLKEMGDNAWRMSHNPPTPELLDACDELGMLVMDENRHLGDTIDHTGAGTPDSIWATWRTWSSATAIIPASSCGPCATRKAGKARPRGAHLRRHDEGGPPI